MASKLILSVLIAGPSGVGKSTLLRRALVAEGSGLVLAAPNDELDSYYGLELPKYDLKAVDDSEYLPSLEKTGQPTGLRDAVRWLSAKLTEVATDFKAGKAPRYAILGIDTISQLGQLAHNAAMVKYGRTEPPPAMSPDGAAFYTYLRQRQQELMRVARQFRAYGVHLIALSHVTETDVAEHNVAKDLPGKTKMHVPNVPGGFKLELPSLFSVVLSAGILSKEAGEKLKLPISAEGRSHFVRWAADPKRVTKSRLGPLGQQVLPNDWKIVKAAIEAAAAKQAVS